MTESKAKAGAAPVRAGTAIAAGATALAAWKAAVNKAKKKGPVRTTFQHSKSLLNVTDRQTRSHPSLLLRDPPRSSRGISVQRHQLTLSSAAEGHGGSEEGAEGQEEGLHVDDNDVGVKYRSVM